MVEVRDTRYGWHEQLAVGASGEYVVGSWLQSRGIDFIDVSNDAHWQSRDIDLIAYLGQGEDRNTVAVEIKTDTYDNGRVFFELYSAELRPGALPKSRADVWLIYKPARGGILKVKPANVLALVLRRDDFKTFPVHNQKGQVRAYGVNIPISTLVADCGAVWYTIVSEGDTNGDTSDSQDPGTASTGV